MLPSAYGLGAWNRTTDLLRVTQVFCQLNYAKMKWSERVESNHQPHRYQRCALAVELRSDGAADRNRTDMPILRGSESPINVLRQDGRPRGSRTPAYCFGDSSATVTLSTHLVGVVRIELTRYPVPETGDQPLVHTPM